MSLIYKVKSDHYGDYHSECVGIMDLCLYYGGDKIPRAESNEWMRDWHPAKYFGSYGLHRLTRIVSEEPSLGEVGRYAVFVPTRVVNRDWDGSDWRRKYGMDAKRHKILPIAQTEAKVKKWQQSLPAMTIPDYFQSARTIEDLQVDIEDFVETVLNEDIEIILRAEINPVRV